jgi:hypothetical protein
MKSKECGIISLFLMVFLLTMTGCEYDVAEPQWDKPHTNPPTPVITAIDPPNAAAAGYNHIKILGENFAESKDDNKVYFNNTEVEVLESSTTSITVRRPNLVTDSARIKVVSYNALVVAKSSGYYKIYPVWDRYGTFLENLQLSIIVVDKAENLYVIQRVPRPVYKITPDGTQTTIGETSRIVTDAKIDRDGKIVLIMNYRRLGKMDPETGEEVEMVDVGKTVSFGDFDQDGNLYVGGRRSDLIVIAPDLTKKSLGGAYASDEILCVRVYNGYVYLLVNVASPNEQNPELAIWRHQILDATGALGDKELVLDWANTGEFAEAAPRNFTFDTKGVMYIGTEHTQPIMILTPDKTQDILYKDILPSYSEQLVWGTGNYLYMLLGGDEWNVVRIDMGQPGAPYFGR